jgi:hypothetical protein
MATIDINSIDNYNSSSTNSFVKHHENFKRVKILLDVFFVLFADRQLSAAMGHIHEQI